MMQPMTSRRPCFKIMDGNNPRSATWRYAIQTYLFTITLHLTSHSRFLSLSPSPFRLHCSASPSLSLEWRAICKRSLIDQRRLRKPESRLGHYLIGFAISQPWRQRRRLDVTWAQSRDDTAVGEAAGWTYQSKTQARRRFNAGTSR